MKSNILPISAALAAIAVVALLSVSVTAAGIAATVFSLLAIIHADYGRNTEPLRPAFQVTAFEPVDCKSTELGEAA
jgi:hypothetical protein